MRYTFFAAIFAVTVFSGCAKSNTATPADTRKPHLRTRGATTPTNGATTVTTQSGRDDRDEEAPSSGHRNDMEGTEEIQPE